MAPLNVVSKNSWNPNYMTPFEEKSLAHGLQHDGWLISQALLIWGTDEKKRKKNLIIDGEHRYEAATKLGFTDGPMVFLNGLTESEAKALTVKMNGKRGSFDRTELSELLRSIQFDIGTESMALEFGIEDEKLMAMLAQQEEILPGAADDPAGPATIEMPSGKSSHVRMVQLFFDETQHTEFSKFIEIMAERTKKKNVTEVVMESLRRACSAS
jgi:hypothetical protein